MDAIPAPSLDGLPDRSACGELIELAALPEAGPALDALLEQVRDRLQEVTEGLLKTQRHILDGNHSVRAAMDALFELRLDLSRTIARIKCAQARSKHESSVQVYRPEQAKRVLDLNVDQAIEFGIDRKAAIKFINDLMASSITVQVQLLEDAGFTCTLGDSVDPPAEQVT